MPNQERRSWFSSGLLLPLYRRYLAFRQHRQVAPELWHLSFVEHLASVLRPRVYVELGVHRCELFNRIVPYAQHCVGVDIDARAAGFMARSRKVRFVNCTTAEFATMLQTQPMSIDMLFIDADHSKDAVMLDFQSFFPFVSSHGLILLHDTHPRSMEFAQPGRFCCDAYKAVEELPRNADEFELMTIPVHPGLTLCRKRTSQLSWMETDV